MTSTALAIKASTDVDLPDPIAIRDAGYVVFWANSLRSANTRAAYLKDLAQFRAYLTAGGADLLAVVRAHIDTYVQGLDLAPSTVKRKIASLSSFYTYLVREGVIENSPVANVVRPKVDKPQELGVEAAQVGELLKLAKTEGPRAYALAVLLATTGMRISEALNADVEDLSVVRGRRVLFITRKGGKGQRIALAPATVQALDLYLAGRTTGPIFVTRQGNHYDRHNAGRLLNGLAQRAGIEGGFHPHTIRHTVVTELLEAGEPLHKVQDLLGHSSSDTTQGYNTARHQLDDGLSRTMERLLGL